LTYILGISAYYHDSAAALIKNGIVISAAQEERFTRIKHDKSFPLESINFILKDNSITLNQIDAVVFYEKPYLKFKRLLKTYIDFFPKGLEFFLSSFVKSFQKKLFLERDIIFNLKKIDSNYKKKKIKFIEHHLSHAASAFYSSPFDESLILTLDGVGESTTTSISIGKKNKIKIVERIEFPHSIGLLYSSFTYYLGFKVNSGEYKVMGLAPYGIPRYKKIILEKIINLKNDGSFKLNMKYFNYCTGLTMINQNFINLFGVEVRDSENGKLEQFHMDIAASIQAVIEDAVKKIVRHAKEKYGYKNLCLAGGVALNCVSNAQIAKEKIYDEIWIQPAAGDAGGALGCAQAYWFNDLRNSRVPATNYMKGSYLGPKFTEDNIQSTLKKEGAVYKKLLYEDLISTVANELNNQMSIGWFQGKMEFGPRALGNRSILADPRSEKMQNNLNLKIKFRESFRPFAPSVLLEKAIDYFEMDNIRSTPYMLLVRNVNKRLKISNDNNLNNIKGLDLLKIKTSTIPAVTHVDFSARVQTVDKKENKKFYDLINEFYKKTGCPLLVNTSFNIRGEPIVCDPKNALDCFMGTNLDVLVIENFILFKKDQKKSTIDYKEKFKLD
jgi:carbamoyltransferase